MISCDFHVQLLYHSFYSAILSDGRVLSCLLFAIIVKSVHYQSVNLFTVYR